MFKNSREGRSRNPAVLRTKFHQLFVGLFYLIFQAVAGTEVGVSLQPQTCAVKSIKTNVSPKLMWFAASENGISNALRRGAFNSRMSQNVHHHCIMIETFLNAVIDALQTEPTLSCWIWEHTNPPRMQVPVLYEGHGYQRGYLPP